MAIDIIAGEEHAKDKYSPMNIEDILDEYRVINQETSDESSFPIQEFIPGETEFYNSLDGSEAIMHDRQVQGLAYDNDASSNVYYSEIHSEKNTDDSLPAGQGYHRPNIAENDEDIRAYVKEYVQDYIDVSQLPSDMPRNVSQDLPEFFMDGRIQDSVQPAGDGVDLSADGDYHPAHSDQIKNPISEECESDEETDDDHSDDEVFFPSSFREYMLSVLTGFLYRIRRISSVDTTEEAEDLGKEVSAINASKYYARFLPSMRLRLKIGGILLLVMLWITLGLPVSGALKRNCTAGLFILSIQTSLMILLLDQVTNAVLRLFRGHPGAETLSVLACLSTAIDALAACHYGTGTSHLPLCFFSSLSLYGTALASYFGCRALRKSFRVPAIGKCLYTVSCNLIPEQKSIAALKSMKPMTGFIHRSEEAAPDETLFEKIFFPVILFSLFCSIILSWICRLTSNFLLILSAFLCVSAPVSALLGFSYPYLIASLKLFRSGVALAGWSGINDLGRSKDIIITDRDLFPSGSVEISSVRIFGELSSEMVIAYAGSMLLASGASISSCFEDLMKEHGCTIRNVENFEFLPGGGMKAVIESSVVTCGGSDFMQLANVKLPIRLIDNTTVLLAVNGILIGIFNMDYKADSSVRTALTELVRSDRHPVFATCDFNITPTMLHQLFDIATDGYDFPSFDQRRLLAEPDTLDHAKVSAVICKEGLQPLVTCTETGRTVFRFSKLFSGINLCEILFLQITLIVRILLFGTISPALLLIITIVCTLPIFIFPRLFL